MRLRMAMPPRAWDLPERTPCKPCPDGAADCPLVAGHPRPEQPRPATPQCGPATALPLQRTPGHTPYPVHPTCSSASPQAPGTLHSLTARPGHGTLVRSPRAQILQRQKGNLLGKRTPKGLGTPNFLSRPSGTSVGSAAEAQWLEPEPPWRLAALGLSRRLFPSDSESPSSRLC